MLISSKELLNHACAQCSQPTFGRRRGKALEEVLKGQDLAGLLAPTPSADESSPDPLADAAR